jgi:rhamnosyltransferase
MADTSGTKRPVTVLVRCYNEMPYTAATMERLFQQRFQDFDVLVVDSSSTDGSFDVFKKWREKEKERRGFQIIQIDKKDYLPGRTLNMAIGKTESKIVVLLNADATPADEFWLERLIAPFQDEKVVAAFCRQMPRPETKAPLRYDTDRFYPPEKPNWNWKYVVHFSHAASAIRRSAWEKRPYYDGAVIAEDKEWAKYWLDNGYKIEYVPETAVLHAHNYTPAQFKRRMYLEALDNMYIYPEMKPSILRVVKNMCGAMLRDLKRCIRNGHVFAVFRSPLLRGAQFWGTYMGLKEGQRRRGAGGGARKDI